VSRPGFADPLRLLACAMAAVAVLGILMPVYTDGRSTPCKRSCPSNLKQLACGLRMYSQHYDDRLPPAPLWEQGLDPYLKNRSLYTCPQRSETPHGYAYNQLLDRKPLKEIGDADREPVFSDSALGVPSGTDRLESFVRPHDGQGVVAYADLRVERVRTAPPADAGLAAQTGGR